MGSSEPSSQNIKFHIASLPQNAQGIPQASQALPVSREPHIQIISPHLIIEEFETELLKKEQRVLRQRLHVANLKTRKMMRQKNMEMIVRTTAPVRHDTYLNSIGLPRSYGKATPFKPFESKHQMRHFSVKDSK